MKKVVNKTTKTFQSFALISAELKRRLVSRMFWGRSNTYKNISHFLVVFISVFVTIGGIAYRVSDVSANQSLSGDLNIGSTDLLQQGGSISTVLPTDSSNALPIESSQYTVQEGDSLANIAAQFNVNIDTIRWFNPNLISPFTNEIKPGWVLAVPKINGVLYSVRSGQSLDDIIAITSVNNDESNKFNIIELNNLVEPYALTEGEKLFIPDGNLIKQGVDVEGIPRGIFINPLSHPGCGGYLFQRGFSFYHDGIDLSKWDGCDLEAVATGTIYYAGWENLSGYTVKIDHGGGIRTYYYHLRDIYVKVGQRVQQGDIVGYMGTTGNSTGTHLHFTLKKDGVSVDPADYVPY